MPEGYRYRYLVWFCYCDKNTLTKSNLIEERTYFHIQVAAHHQGKSEQELKQELEGRTLAIPCSIISNQRTYSLPRKNSRNYGEMIAGWLPHSGLASFLMKSRATYLMNDAALVGWALLHQLILTDMLLGQSYLGSYTIETFLLDDSRLCQVDHSG